MVTEVIMSRKFFVILLLAAYTDAVHASCYYRVAMSSQRTVKMISIADVKRIVVPLANSQHKCLVKFRAQVNDTWINVEGENVTSDSVNFEQLCAGAMTSGKNRLLSRVSANNINVEQDMVCTDEPEIQIRKVSVGEHVKESELKPHPNFPKQFEYRGTACRWFIEPEGRVGDLISKQGIACQIQDNDWQVVDKW